MLRRTALRQQSERAVEREAAFRRTSVAVKQRANYRCEGCGHRLGPGEGDTHHIAGRTHLRRDLADRAELLALLCRPCHEFVTRTPGCSLDVRLKREAVERLTGRALPEGVQPMDVLRKIEREGLA